MLRQYDESKKRHSDLENQCLELMDKMVDHQSSVSDIIDGFFQYKINRYRNRLDLAFRKMRRETVCDSDIIMADLLEPQFFINSLQDKIMQQHRYITEPFKHGYAIRELTNAITERFSFGTDYSKISNLPSDLSSGGAFGSAYQYRARFSYNRSESPPSLRPQTPAQADQLTEAERQLLREHQQLRDSLSKLRTVNPATR